jgi:diadenosine tetraphosphate (Ap4A) HIT family hydrolase
MVECIFCKIVAGTAPCVELYRDEATLAFMAIAWLSRALTLRRSSR